MKIKHLFLIQFLALILFCVNYDLQKGIDDFSVSENIHQITDNDYSFDGIYNSDIGVFGEQLNVNSNVVFFPRTLKNLSYKYNLRTDALFKTYNSDGYYTFNFLKNSSLQLKYKSQSHRLFYLRKIRV